MHYTGFILSKLRTLCRGARVGDETVTIDNMQGNGTFCIYQARVRLRRDPQVYRLILAPADAPIFVNDIPIAHHFPKPLGSD